MIDVSDNEMLTFTFCADTVNSSCRSEPVIDFVNATLKFNDEGKDLVLIMRAL